MDAKWRLRKRKKEANKTKGQTSGRLKGTNCQVTVMERFFYTRSRSYKHKNYGEYLRKCILRNSKK